jgi:hypothetical protein
LIELAVEQDEEALMNYLEGVEPSIEKLKECIRKGCLEFAFTPVITGTAFKNKGVQTLLDAVVDYMPSPLDRPAIQGVDAIDITKVIERPSSDEEPFSALAFKIMNDPFVGTLTFTRIYSGILAAGRCVRALLLPYLGPLSRPLSRPLSIRPCVLSPWLSPSPTPLPWALSLTCVPALTPLPHVARAPLSLSHSAPSAQLCEELRQGQV